MYTYVETFFARFIHGSTVGVVCTYMHTTTRSKKWGACESKRNLCLILTHIIMYTLPEKALRFVERCALIRL
jgi:hypothetical protein